MKIEFTVFGLPAPQGSKRHVGNGVMIESSKKLKPWREDVRQAALAVVDDPTAFASVSLGPWLVQRMPVIPINEPVLCRMVFTMPKPKSAPKKRRTYHDRTPDLSKLIRSTEDAIVSAGLLRDDARIVGYTRAAKVFPNEDPESLPAPGVSITIETITGE